MNTTSTLRVEVHRLIAAALGPENPLPPLRLPERVAATAKADDSVPPAAREHLGYGCDTGCLPYRLQDGYDRHRQPRPFQVAILENEFLRATFLLEYGGRLWSLIHKPTERELLDSNPVFQPANLAVRNAWFSGGVEWNCGVQGHTPLTCSPVFAARVRADDGTPILRLYEWERIRGVPYQLDFSLSAGSPWLFARVRILNPHDRTIPMYWWSNIAVAETPGLRVLAPADAAYNFGYVGAIKRVPVPRHEGRDVTYPANIPRSADFFYDLAAGQRPWIAALDANGRGLIQTSTARLRGRKLFTWGMGSGGRQWQEFLSVPGQSYIEIQAGLAPTQYECRPMPARAEWSWLEAYGCLAADRHVVHGCDWAAARREVERRLERALPAAALESELTRTAGAADRIPDEILHRGSGWGALERRRRAHAGQPPVGPPALAFDDDSLGDDQTPWLELLERGAMPPQDPPQPPGAWMVQDEWRQMLADALATNRGDHWLSWLHLGVMHHHAGDFAPARQAWETSLARHPSAWALRNLALMDKNPGLWLQAHQLAPAVIPLAIETVQALLDAARPADAIQVVVQLAPAARAHGRIRALEARAALDLGQWRQAETILQDNLVVPDLREGELSLSELWYAVESQRLVESLRVPLDASIIERVRRECAVPKHLDFRAAAL